MSLARLTLTAGSRLVGKSVGEIEAAYRLNIVLVRSNQHSEMHPSATRLLQRGDTLAILGNPEALHLLLHDNG